MRFALIIDDYLPHSTRVGAKMFHELACHFVSMGHEVTVITPAENQKQSLMKTTLDGVEVWSFSSGKIKNVSKLKRAVNETLLSFHAWRAISREVKPSTFDGIIYYSPSIFFGSLVSKIKERCHCKAYLVLRDLFPQWVVDAGMIRKGSIIEKYFKYFEKISYQQADIIGLMSDRNEELFSKLNSDNYPTEVLRNWAALEPFKSPASVTNIRRKFGLEDKVIYFYGGNIGHAQDMTNLMRLVRAMSEKERAHFLFIGQGDEVDLVNRLADEWMLENFTYLPSISQEEFRTVLQEIDVGLFSLSADHTAHNFPGKLLGYMVETIPILGSVNEGNDLLDVLINHEAGFVSVNGDDQTLFNNAKRLLEDSELRRKVGLNAYSLLKEEFSVQSAAETIVTAIGK